MARIDRANQLAFVKRELSIGRVKRIGRGVEGDKLENFNGLVKHQTIPLSSLQNGQVTKSNRTYTLREFPERFAKKIG